MRYVEKHTVANGLVWDETQMAGFTSWLDIETTDGLAQKSPMEAEWRDNIRQYEGVPALPVRNVPIEDAPNIEVTLGAIATDSLYAQAIDLMFSVKPPLTARAIQGKATDAVKGLQKFINWGVDNEWGVRDATNHTIFDSIQLGTGIFYVPFVEQKRKTKVSKITSRHPKIFSIPPEDFILPGGATDGTTSRWAALRWYLTLGQVQDRAKANQWDISKITPCGALGPTRTYRERMGRTQTANLIVNLYEIWEIFPTYDIDGDGFDEDLHVIYDYTAKKILHLAYNKYDRRPTEMVLFQIRAHLAWGLGVMSMIRPYEESVTEQHCFRLLNQFLANCRFWLAVDGSVPESMKIWPGKVQSVQHKEDISAVAMADVYPSALSGEAIDVSYAERRVGVNESNAPKPSQILSSRTPAMTAMSAMQQANRRFTPAFDAMRNGVAAAVRQCLYRYQERLLSGDEETVKHIQRVIGDEDAQKVIDLLKDKDFDEAVSVELTTASASVNRDADRQNAILLQQILVTYYEKILQLVSIAGNPQTPKEVRSVAKKIAKAAGELVDRTIRTFESIRDPETFLVNAEEELDKINTMASQGLTGLGAIMNRLAHGAGQEMAAAPNGAAPPPQEQPA